MTKIEYDLPTGHLSVTASRLSPLPLIRHEIQLMDKGEHHKWIVDCREGLPVSAFDLIFMRLFKGSYLDFADWIRTKGIQGVLPGTFIFKPREGITVALDPPEVNDDEILVGLYVKFGSSPPYEEYSVSVTPHTPVGLLARTVLYLKKKEVLD